MTEHQNLFQRILHWLRAGYPEGVPQGDYVALLGILHRSLTDAEVAEMARLLGADAETAVDEDRIRRLIEERVHERASDDDVRRVSARLASGGWPLAGAPTRSPDEAVTRADAVTDPASDPVREPEDEEEERPGVLARVVAWVREGYPNGVPDQDYVPLLALLQRRLTKKEVKAAAKALRRNEVSPAGPDDIAAAITALTAQPPSESDVDRVARQLTKKGWPVELEEPPTPSGH